MSSRELEGQNLMHQIELFDAALVAGDYECLRRCVSPNYMMINPLAQRLNKEAWLGWLRRDIRYHRIERNQVSYRVLGAVWIVTSEVRAAMSVAGLSNGEPGIHHTFRTELWVISADGLLLEHVHLTRME